MDALVNIEKTLQTPIERFIKREIIELVRVEFESIKASFVPGGNEQMMNQVGVKECIFETQNNYIEVFTLFEEANYYAAWQLLERIEIDIKWLLRYCESGKDEYKILFIKKNVSQLQQLYPYRVFASSEVVQKEVRCSICDSIITLRNRCSHKKGELYMGKMCVYNVSKAEFIGLSIVKEPFNRYSVAGVTCKEDDPYKYPEIEFLMKVIDHPFNKWRFEKYEIYDPHENYKAGRNDPCPCGSGTKYKSCCLKNEGVKVPHTQFYFEEPTLNGRNIPGTQIMRREGKLG